MGGAMPPIRSIVSVADAGGSVSLAIRLRRRSRGQRRDAPMCPGERISTSALRVLIVHLLLRPRSRKGTHEKSAWMPEPALRPPRSQARCRLDERCTHRVRLERPTASFAHGAFAHAARS